MSFELLETIQVTQKELPPKSASRVLKLRNSIHFQHINYSEWLHSNDHRRNALAYNVTAQAIVDEKHFLFMHINDTLIAQWFKEQFGLG